MKRSEIRQLKQSEGGRQVQRSITYFNLDLILAIGYRWMKRCQPPNLGSLGNPRLAVFDQFGGCYFFIPQKETEHKGNVVASSSNVT